MVAGCCFWLAFGVHTGSMTAIVGLNYSDGVMMMADTEEYLGGDAKSTTDKLHRFVFPIGMNAGTVITGGSGDAHLIECANQEMHQFFVGYWRDRTGLPKPDEMLECLSSFASKFFCETMEAYHGAATEVVPLMDLLIAVNWAQRSYLFCWKQNRVLWISPPKHAIGSGIVQLHPMLRDIEFSGTKESMFFHGIRLMYYTKRAVLGVGGRTEAIALLNTGESHFFGTEAAQQAEELAKNLDEFISKIIYQDVSNIAPDVKDLDENVKKSIDDLPRSLEMYREAYRKILGSQLKGRDQCETTEL